MSGALPTTYNFAVIDFESVDERVIKTRAHSGRVFRKYIGGHFFRMTLTYPTLAKEEYEEIYAFLNSQQGQYDVFTVTVQDKNTPRGVATGTPLVNGASQTGKSIVTDGWTASVTNIMRAGDLIKFAGHTKVYMVDSDVNSNASGQATIAITPALVVSPADNEAITVSNVPFTVTRTSGIQSYSGRAGNLYELTFQCEENY